MGSVVQFGDIVAFGRLAWQLYEFGWSEELQAERQYREFGQDLRGLAESLDILVRVVENAKQTLRTRGTTAIPVRYDLVSLTEITGDVLGTLRECRELLIRNKSFRSSNGAFSNIGWNALVAPSVLRLQRKLLLHNSKIQLMLQPLEIDLLSRIYEDLNRLDTRLDHIHTDIRQIMGVLIPDLTQELNELQMSQNHLLGVPRDIAEKFKASYLDERPVQLGDQDPTLDCLADVLVTHFQASTRSFRSGLLVEQRTPTPEQYVNLLKSIWLLRIVKESLPHQPSNSPSHWPSYIKRLEDEVSRECQRFSRELQVPQIISATLDTWRIWPQVESRPLLDTVTNSVPMEEIQNIPLSADSEFIERKLQIMRHLRGNGMRFRLNISGTRRRSSADTQEVITLDLNKDTIKPFYADPNPELHGPTLDMILSMENSTAQLPFSTLKDVLKFQQAVVGFKVWEASTQYNVRVHFAVSGQRQTFSEDATLQLWTPKQLRGKLITGAEQDTNDDNTARRVSSASTAFEYLPLSLDNQDSFFTSDDPYSAVTAGNAFSRSSSINSTLPQFTLSQPSSSRTPNYLTNQTDMIDPLTRMPSTSRNPDYFSNRSNPNRLSTSLTPASRRQSVVSSTTTSPLSSQSSSGRSSSDRATTATTTVQTGAGTAARVHRQPLRPMLVLFTRSRDATTTITSAANPGRLSIVAVHLDDDTAVNPLACDCRMSGRAGRSCPTAAIERNRGKAPLFAHRFSGARGWDVARLAEGRRSEAGWAEAEWPRLVRVSLTFEGPEARARFAGTPSECRCRARTRGEMVACLRAGHQGPFGEVKQHYRDELDQYHRGFREQRHLVTGTREDNLGML